MPDTQPRQRVQRSMRLDSALIDLLDEEANEFNLALARHVENILWDYCQAKKLLPADLKKLGERRGK